MDLPVDFKELLAEFARAGVEAVVVGGYAVAFHGRPRATKDLDLLLDGSDENLARTAAALDGFGAPPNVVRAVRGLKEDEIVYMGQPPLRVDLLRIVDGVATEAIFERAVATEIDAVPLRVIGLDDLIANKRAAGRKQDLIDAEFLERVRAAKK